MASTLSAWIAALLGVLSLPSVGLSAIFVVSLVSATLLPMGSEPAVFGYVKLAPDMFWPAILVATLGNTAGGIISYWMGLGAARAYIHWKRRQQRVRRTQQQPQPALSTAATSRQHADAAPPSPSGGRWHQHLSHWLRRMGPYALLFSWLPVVGDPLCAVAGWLRLPFWPSVACMAVGKFMRYLVMTAGLLWFFPHVTG